MGKGAVGGRVTSRKGQKKKKSPEMAQNETLLWGKGNYKNREGLLIGPRKTDGGEAPPAKPEGR